MHAKCRNQLWMRRKQEKKKRTEEDDGINAGLTADAPNAAGNNDRGGGERLKKVEETEDNRIMLAVYNIQKQFRIYHVGVFVRGKEFHYGMRIGVFRCEPMNSKKTFRVRYWHKMVCWSIEFMRYVPICKQFPLRTALSLEQIQRISANLGERIFMRDNYHLLNHNCLDFARAFIRSIAVQHPPSGCWSQEIRQPLIIQPIRMVFCQKHKQTATTIDDEANGMSKKGTKHACQQPIDGDDDFLHHSNCCCHNHTNNNNHHHNKQATTTASAHYQHPNCANECRLIG